MALFFSFEALGKGYLLFVVFSHFLENDAKWGTKKASFTRQQVFFDKNLFSNIGLYHKKAP